MRERVGAVTGATADAILAIFIGRELRKPRKAGQDLNRWQTFATLWRMSWEPPERESRKDRVLAWVATGGIHLFLLFFWAWLAYVRVPPAPPPAGDDSVVQVEFIGEGTPEETGGGAPEGDVPDDPRQAAAPAAAPVAPAASAPVPPAQAEPPQPQPEPEQPAEAVAQQPVQVSEPVQPLPRFELPPTTPPEVEMTPRVRPQVVVVPRQRTVELVEQPTPPQVRTEVQPRPIDVPQVRATEQTVRQREVPLVLPPREMPELAAPSESTEPARVQAPERSVRSREIALEPAPARATAPSAATGSEGAQPAARDAVQGGRPDSTQGQRQAQSRGTGATPSTRPGAWPTPTRGDDWGEALRNRPGGNPGANSGVFGDDGRPRLPPGTAQPGGGFPPGSDNWTRDLLDRHGTWASRPPLGYEPTRFDRYWIPSGTLLQEWVRRGVKSLDIPIPGSSKTITCTVSILQLGGGCGISDANLQDREATARPPPDIPFKPELQEDNGSN